MTKVTSLGIILLEVSKLVIFEKGINMLNTGMSIREMRGRTGLTQKAFSELFGIPVSTLRKWEQGEASPPEYVVRLLARILPGKDQGLLEIRGANTVFYLNTDRQSVTDQKGNEIYYQEDLQGVKERNLVLYLEDLFSDFYAIQDRFNRDCRYDKQENIIWTR